MNLPKILFSALLFYCALCSSLQAVAAKSQSHSKKMYVDYQSVKATSQGIMVSKGKYTFSVKAIRSDQKGLFLLKKDLLPSIREGFRTTKISNCL
jgi:hypothetical protein